MSQNLRTSALIWDMGGVILRTVDPSPRTELAAEIGTNRRHLEKLFFSSETAILAEAGQIEEEQHWDWLFATLALRDMSRSEFRRRFFQGDVQDEQLVEYIRSLKPDYKMGLLSNAWLSSRQNIAREYSFLPVFDEAIFSAEVSARKPGAEIYRIMLKRLKVEPRQAIFIDDMLANVEGARAVGMKAVRFENTQQTIQELEDLL